MTCFSSTRFFISSTFTSNTRLKLAKMQAKTNQNPKTELLPFENHSISSSMLPSKTNFIYSKKCAKTSVYVLMRLCDSL